MAYENIKLLEQNMVVVDRCFYTFDSTHNYVLKVTSDGELDFLYPIVNCVLGKEVKSLEYDGFYFWSLQEGTLSSYDVSIKKWEIDNYCFKLKDEIDLVGDLSNRYDSDAFTVEHYHTSFFSTVCSGSNYVEMDDYCDDSVIVSSGTVLVLGPNSNGYYEEVTVTGSLSDTKAGLLSNILYSYEEGDDINFNKYVWLFNNYNGVDTVGSLYKFDSNSGSYIERFDDGEYKNINACTFNKISDISHVGVIHSLIYVKSNNLKFLNVYSDPFSFYCVMNMDNVKSNGFDIINIYDLCVCRGSVYRLQKEAMYYGSDYLWTNYNYQLSPLRNFIDSITVGAYPTILPATGVNKSDVTASVHDQYSEPIKYKPVLFYENDDVGYMTLSEAYTDEYGLAISYYIAGIVPAIVVITAIATQYD